MNTGRLTNISSTGSTDLGGFYAQAYEYDSSGAKCVDSIACSIYRAKITINTPDFKTLPSGTVRRDETMTHEMGHVLGLSHEDRPGYYSIMQPGDDGITDGFIDNRNPQTDDFNGIKAIYEN